LILELSGRLPIDKVVAVLGSKISVSRLAGKVFAPIAFTPPGRVSEVSEVPKKTRLPIDCKVEGKTILEMPVLLKSSF
jgi:hypothetical protein